VFTVCRATNPGGAVTAREPSLRRRGRKGT